MSATLADGSQAGAGFNMATLPTRAGVGQTTQCSIHRNCLCVDFVCCFDRRPGTADCRVSRGRVGKMLALILLAAPLFASYDVAIGDKADVTGNCSIGVGDGAKVAGNHKIVILQSATWLQLDIALGVVYRKLILHKLPADCVSTYRSANTLILQRMDALEKGTR